ncbi:hypothetical protein [Schleiferia thermophila]|jgi:hypothetical protein|uniref:Uncharacterized protein n=1 Tax=Schleiferia thermophila TaxID=884107 RepID=A0A368ZVW3_9FLAO|nr:hypothetical protein [Schleiferia thermophila]KFD38269.1 hypothetical protein AT05_10930 [Schleiferia thermophila str. Yellowstone]PMB17518.1 hypothetical protein CEN47_25795 [Fischerella thermalis CCMEE 5319]RCX01101.1 hypothetical protein DES35_1086 [Schleiferia thermophila]GCD80232.1 hypothetical protein JCM30197_14790 [Schleiferia thermophila]
MKLSNTIKIVEIAWLVVITICLYEIVRNTVLGSYEKISLYAVVGAGATVMYFLRRNQRKRLSRNEKINSDS